jgi:hypothetical protein
MNRLAIAVSLQDENARPFGEVWVVLEDLGIHYASDHIRC